MAISKRVNMGDGTRLMDTISDSLILSEDIAIRRGTAEIREKWLVKKSRTIQVPFDCTYAEGDVHEINNPRVNIVCDAVARSVTHVLEPASRVTKMTLETAKRFE
jgi:hypothetical protein